MAGIIGNGKCFDCGVEPTRHIPHYISAFVSCLTTPLMQGLARSRAWRRMSSICAWCVCRSMPLHYGFSHMLGIVRYRNEVHESCSDRGKLVFTSAKERGLDIEQIAIYRKPVDIFRVRLPIESGAENKKTHWFYFDSLPLVPWKDRTYTQWIDDKYALKQFFTKHHIPVPRCVSVQTLGQAIAAMGSIGTPVTVKPQQGSRSRHTTIAVTTEDDLRVAFAKSRVISHHIVVEEQLYGKVCRATVVEGVLVGFVEFSHPKILGDGVSTIRQLIQLKNERRNKRYKSELSCEKKEIYFLAEAGYDFDTVLKAEEQFILQQRAGWLYGGDDREMVSDVHPQLVKIIERAADLLNAQVVGFDLIIEDPESDPAPQKWGIIEANSMPYIEVHSEAMSGERVNVGLKIWDMWREIPPLWK